MRIMKRLNTLFIIFTFTLSTIVLISKAQVYTSTNYYYNNFDGGQIGNGISKIGTSEALKLSTTATGNIGAENGYSLVSSGNNAPGSYQFAFLSNNTNLNNENFGWEWTFLYRNTENTANSSDVILSGQNAWKYWFLSSGNFDNPNTGYYLTQDGSNLKFRWRYSNEPWENRFNELASFDMSSLGIGWQNKTYAIRVQRLKRQGQFVWHLYVDEYTATNKEAKTERGNPAYHNTLDTYTNVNSGLHINATTSGRFKFDEIKMYSMKFEIKGANDASFGISNPLYNGQKDAVIYGLQIMTRGLFDINTIILDMSVSDGSKGVGSIFENSRLFRSTDNYFGNTDDSYVVGLNIDWRQIKAEGFAKTRMFTIGATDGSMLPAAFYFIKADVKTDAPSGVTYSFTNLNKVGGEAAQIDYVAQPGVNGGGTTTNPSTSGGTKDWVGATSSNWNTDSNWLPVGVPGVNDLARIGVTSFGSNPNPVLSSSSTVGNILFGNNTPPTLTINSGFTLTVNNVVENQAACTIAGMGTLDVKGTFKSKPSSAPAKTTTSTINTLNVANLLLSSDAANVVFDYSGQNITVKNSLQTTGANAISFRLANGSTLTLTGATPFSIGGSPTMSFNGTVLYGAAVQQSVNTAFSYGNIAFSGLGIKEVAKGTLSVNGNWSSSGGKVNLTSTAVNFNGTNQTITDTGSDDGNGINFGNISLLGGTKTLAGAGKFAVTIGKYLTLGANTTLQTSDKLTLRASALGSASVAAIPSSSSVQGKVTVEKYIQGGPKAMWRSYRMLSSPIYDNDNSSNRTYSFEQFIDDMLITGRTTGFDQLNNSAVGAWTYNDVFVPITVLNTAVNVGRGAYILYRGDRTNGLAKVTAPYVDPESIVMNFKGTLNQQSVTVPLTHGAGGFSMLGNPYAATIDWNAVIKSSNVSSTIRIWNPGKKQYATYNGIDTLNGGSRFIGPGQGFFVQTTNNASPSVTFTEASKVSDVAQTTPLYNKVMSVKDQTFSSNFSSDLQNSTEVQPAKIRIKLTRDGFDNEDETLIVLKENELASFSGYDTERSGGEAVFLSSLSAEGTKMGINYMPHISSVSTLNLDVNVSNNGGYKLLIDLTDIPMGYELKLRDKYLNTFTDIKGEGNTYALVIDRAIVGSLNDRFEILIAPTTTLPVVLSDFNGAKTGQGVLLNWKTSSEANNSHFEIFRAGEDQSYLSIGEVISNDKEIYSLLDKSPLVGNNYYRLVQVDKNGTSITLPKTVAVKYDLNINSKDGMLIYPTIVQSSFTLKYMGSLNSNQYIFKITDISGKEIYKKSVDKTSIINGYKGELTGLSGVYFATLIDAVNGRKIATTKLVKK